MSDIICAKQIAEHMRQATDLYQSDDADLIDRLVAELEALKSLNTSSGLHGFTWQPFERRLTGPNGGCYASVWSNGTWHTWDENGTGGDNNVAPGNVAEAMRQAEAALVRQGWNVERKHPREQVEELAAELAEAREVNGRMRADIARAFNDLKSGVNTAIPSAMYWLRSHTALAAKEPT